MRIRDLWNGVSAKEAIKEFATAILVVVGIWAYLWTLDFLGVFA
jgi:hypothetical protein